MKIKKLTIYISNADSDTAYMRTGRAVTNWLRGRSLICYFFIRPAFHIDFSQEV